MPALQHVNVEAMDPLRFESVLAVGEFEALRYLIADAARGLHGRVIWNVNSTANGGGVAEDRAGDRASRRRGRGPGWKRKRSPCGPQSQGPCQTP